MVDSLTDNLDFRSAARPAQRRKNHLARYHVNGRVGNIPKVKLSNVTRSPVQYFTTYDAPLFYAFDKDKSISHQYDPTEGMTPGNARRALYKAIVSKQSRARCSTRSGCEICHPPPTHLAENMLSKRHLRNLVKKGSWRADDACVGYREVRVSLWDEGILDDDFYAPDGGGLWGGDWSGAVDIAEQKFRDKSQGLSLSASPSVTPGDSPRTLPQSPSWAAVDDWVLWDDDYTDYSSSDWEVV